MNKLLTLAAAIGMAAVTFGGPSGAQTFQQGEIIRGQFYYCAGETEAMNVVSGWLEGGWDGFKQAYLKYMNQNDAVGDPICGIVETRNARALSIIGSFDSVGPRGRTVTFHLILVKSPEYTAPFVVFSLIPFVPAGDPA